MSTFTREKSRFNIVSASPNFAAPGLTGMRAGFSKINQMSHKVFAIILIGLVVATGLFVGNIQTSAAANAGPFEDWTCDIYRGPLYDKQGWGTTANVPETSISNSIANLVDLANNNRLTAYEMYGTAGTNYTMWHSVDREDLDDSQAVGYTYADGTESKGYNVPKTSAYWANNWMDCTGATGVIGNGIANVLLSGTEVGVSILNFIYGLAFDGPKFMLIPFYQQVNLVIADLKDTLYLPFAVFMVMIGALWMAYIGLWKKRTTEAFQGSLWMIGSAMGGIFLLSNPAVIPDAADQLVGGITVGVGDTLTRNATNNIDNVMCRTGAPLQAFDPMGGTETYVISDTSRKMQCAIWYNLVYTPWVVGQFGASPSGVDADSLAIIGNSGNDEMSNGMLDRINIAFGDGKGISRSDKTWPLVQLNSQAMNQNISNQGNAGEQSVYVQASGAAVAYQQLVVNADQGSTWNGMNPLNRITVAGTSLLAMLCSAILILIFSVLMITYQVTMVFLMLMMPFFLLIGVHPGMGRRIALRWLEMVMNLAIKRIMVSVLLGVFMLLYALIISSASIWFVANTLILAVTIVGLSYRGKIMNTFANVDFGGDKSFGGNSDGGDNKAINFAKKAAGAAVGAGVGAIAAGSIVKDMSPGAAGLLQGNRPKNNGGNASPGNAGVPATGGAPRTAGPARPGGINPAPAETVTTPATSATTGDPQVVSATSETAPATPVAPVESREATQRQRGDATAEAERIRKLKSRAVLSAAIQGGAQGAAGNLKGAMLNSFVAGVNIADTIHDNEVTRQENLERTERDEERHQRDEERNQRNDERDQARYEREREHDRLELEARQRQAAAEEAAEARRRAAEAAASAPPARPNIVLPPSRNIRNNDDAPSRLNSKIPPRKTQLDYDAAEEREINKRNANREGRNNPSDER